MAKFTILQIDTAYSRLDKAKYDKMATSDRFALIKAMRQMKKVAKDFEEFREDAAKRLRPDGFDAVENKINEIRNLAGEEQTKALTDPANADALKKNFEYQNSITECIKEEAEKEVSLDFAPLSEEAFGKLIDGNPDWTCGVALEMEDILRAETETAPETDKKE